MSKEYNFKNSKLNKTINITNLVLIAITVILFILWIFTFIFISMTAMWRQKPKQIRFPLERYQGISLLKTNTVFIEKIEDDYLYFSITNDVSLIDEFELYNNLRYEYLSVYIDQELVAFDNDNQIIIPSGNHEILFNIRILVKIETYNDYEAIQINIDRDDTVILSEEFRTLDDSERTSNYLIIYSKDSVGNYVYPINRLPIYRTLVISYWVSVVYTSLNFIKIIILFIMNRSNNKTIKKQES